MLRLRFYRVWKRWAWGISFIVLLLFISILATSSFRNSTPSPLLEVHDPSSFEINNAMHLENERGDIWDVFNHFTPHLGKSAINPTPSHLKYGLTSQFGQDKFLYEYIIGPLMKKRGKGFTGFFVEFGARDGVEHSNSNFLEKTLGWSGILVEPVYSEFSQIRENRPKSMPFNGALCDREGFVEFVSVEGPQGFGLSGFRTELENSGQMDSIQKYVDEGTASMKIIDMKCMDLNKLLKQRGASTINLMSADCEGCERTVLEHHDWDAFPIEILLMESPKQSDNWLPLLMLLHSKGMRLITIWASDFIFVSKKVLKELA